MIGAVEEFRVRDRVLQKLLLGAGVGKIAPPLPRNKKLLAQLLILLKKLDAAAFFRGSYSSKHAGGASPHNQYLAHFFSLSDRLERSTFPPT